MEKCLNKMDEIEENELEMNEMKVTVKFRQIDRQIDITPEIEHDQLGAEQRNQVVEIKEGPPPSLEIFGREVGVAGDMLGWGGSRKQRIVRNREYTVMVKA